MDITEATIQITAHRVLFALARSVTKPRQKGTAAALTSTACQTDNKENFVPTCLHSTHDSAKSDGSGVAEPKKATAKVKGSESLEEGRIGGKLSALRDPLRLRVQESSAQKSKEEGIGG